MRRSEKDFALCLLDLHNRAVTYQLLKTTEALKQSIDIALREIREREEAEVLTQVPKYYDRNGDVLP